MTKAGRFRELHHGSEILLLPNAWDVGSARLLEHLGFSAVATTSGGAAAAHGKLDGSLDRAATLAHAEEMAAAVAVPVSADLENCFADEPSGVAETIRLARSAGLAGASVEDWSGTRIYDRALAVDRVRAAVEAAEGELVITARAENHIRGVDDVGDTIARLQDFAQAGADVAYAPGLRTEDQIRAVVTSVGLPLNILVGPGVPPVAELAAMGVRRVSVGGSFAFAAYGELVAAAEELRARGTYGYSESAARGRDAAGRAFVES